MNLLSLHSTLPSSPCCITLADSTTSYGGLHKFVSTGPDTWALAAGFPKFTTDLNFRNQNNALVSFGST